MKGPQQMADFLASVVAAAAVMLIERLYAYLVRTVFVIALEPPVHPA